MDLSKILFGHIMLQLVVVPVYGERSQRSSGHTPILSRQIGYN